MECMEKGFLKIHVRHCMLLLYNMKYSKTEAFRQINDVYGNNTISRITVLNWYDRFESGDYSLDDKKRSGRPRELSRENILEALNENSKVSTRDLGKQFGVDHTTISRVLEELGKVRKFGTWIPKKLTDENKTNRVSAARSLLEKYFSNEDEEESILSRLITGDEKWIRYQNPDNRPQWLSPTETPSPRISKPLHPKKNLLCVWWDCRGIIYQEVLGDNETITAEKYSNQLMLLDQAIKNKRPEIYEKGVILQHDNARPHVAKSTKKVINNLGWEVLVHPPYSPDLAPSDYHLFRSMSTPLRGVSFKNTNEVCEWLDNWYSSKCNDFYRYGIFSLIDRWEKVVEIEGEYLTD